MTDEEGYLECPMCSNMHLQLVLSKYQVINHKPWLDSHGHGLLVLSSHHPQKGRKTDFYHCQYCDEFEQENDFGDNAVYQSNVTSEFIHEVNEQ